MAKLDDFKIRVNHVIKLGKTASKDYVTKGLKGSYTFYNKTSFQEFRSASLSLINSLYGTKHPYFIEFANRCRVADKGDIDSGLGIVLSIKTEIENGWLNTVKGLVSAEVFSDFLEMGEYLLDEGYKDPAAVVLGSVLEEHLRQLCSKNGVDTHSIKDGKSVPKKADLLNAELTKKGVYNILDQKQVTAWLDLRNKAAHGNYSDYSSDQVNLMYQGIIGFVARIN